MDQDHSQDMTRLIKQEARSMMDDQQDIINSSFQRTTPPTPAKTAAEKAASEKAKADKAKAARPANTDVTIALETPNDACCWYWTNGLHCPNKLKDSSGKCKFTSLHGTCGMQLADGTFCKGKHKAIEHQ